MVDWRSSFAIGSFSKAMSPCLVAIFPPYEDTTLKIMIVGDIRPLLSPRRFLPYGTARTTPLPSCGDPARVRRRGQRAPAGGPETADTMVRRWIEAVIAGGIHSIVRLMPRLSGRRQTGPLKPPV